MVSRSNNNLVAVPLHSEYQSITVALSSNETSGTSGWFKSNVHFLHIAQDLNSCIFCTNCHPCVVRVRITKICDITNYGKHLQLHRAVVPHSELLDERLAKLALQNHVAVVRIATLGAEHASSDR